MESFQVYISITCDFVFYCKLKDGIRVNSRKWTRSDFFAVFVNKRVNSLTFETSSLDRYFNIRSVLLKQNRKFIVVSTTDLKSTK